MKKLVLALFLALSSCGTPAYAEPETNPFYKRVEELSAFVREHTDFKVTSTPKFVFLSKDTINRVYHGDKFKDQTNIEAMSIGNVIFLAEDLEMGKDDDTLVHELVHYMQWETGPEGTCIGLLEHQAYTIQDKFNESRGDPRRADIFMLFLMKKACENPGE